MTATEQTTYTPGQSVRCLATGELGRVYSVNPFGVPTVEFRPDTPDRDFCQLAPSEVEAA
jgi:hypothetical protein